MNPTPDLINELYREEVLAARRMTLEEKFLAGLELFDYACRVAMDGIRAQHPEADERRVAELLRERLALAQRLEQSRDD